MISQPRRSAASRLRRILHPTNFSALDTPVFRIACALARDAEAELIVAHVASAEQLYRRSEYREGIERRLEALRSSEPDLYISTVILSGPVASEIAGLAGDLSCNLIVMRESSFGWITGRFTESLSQRVKRMASCPTVCVSRDRLQGGACENHRIDSSRRIRAARASLTRIYDRKP